MVRVLAVDDLLVVWRGLVSILRYEPDMAWRRCGFLKHPESGIGCSPQRSNGITPH